MTTPSNSDSVFNASGTIPFPDLARVSEVNETVLSETARAIYTANPNCLIGYSFDNIKLYRQRVKEYKLSHPK